MIYVTGDTHGNIDFKKLKHYFSKRYVTRQDYLIILGDAGIVWSEDDCYIYDYESLGLTVFYVDGNHENFDLLGKFPIVTVNGTKCHRLSQSIYHVLRGEILILNGLSFFCMGGATSIDKYLRVEGVSWWQDENISTKDIENGLSNLDRVGYKVDYVITHCAPSGILMNMFGYGDDCNSAALEMLRKRIEFKHWYFGHYHDDVKHGKYRCFYKDILEVRVTNETREIPYNVLYKDEEGFLRNLKTCKRVKIKASDLPEWYSDAGGYYYSLKGVTDVAFRRSWTDNHLDKDASVYLHYHGKLKHNDLYEPLNPDEWDFHSWRDCSKEICLGLEKYSPHLKLDKLKAAINLNYDHYNQRWELMEFSQQDVVVRPFPEADTPHYCDKHSREMAQYAVYHGQTILSEFLKLQNAINYAELYLSQKLKNKSTRRIEGGEGSDYLYAFDTSCDYQKWVFIRKIA